MTIGIWGGRIHDWRFARIKKKTPNFQPKHARDLEGFPIERCRAGIIMYYLPLYLLGIIGYGWTLQEYTSIAAPMVFALLIGIFGQVNQQITQLLLVDMFPTNAGASSATVRSPLLR
jgi:hypothetical protein